MAASTEKIAVHSLADLKNTSDDAIPNYLASLKFTQSHFVSDVRLLLGYTAFAICAATFYWDYKLGFDATKHYTAIAVALYTALNSLLTLWIWGVENGNVYMGSSPSGQKIEISSSTTKHVPIYNLTIKVSDNGKEKTLKISRPFMEWFDAAGHFVPLPFQQMFASEVEIIGKADPRRVVKTGGNGKAAQVASSSASMEEKWASLLEESAPAVTGVEASEPKTPSKRSKGKKKA